jgi:hypothetical protein
MINGTVNIENCTDDMFQSLSQKKIIFGHQSVGENLMSGIELLCKEKSITQPLNFVEINQETTIDTAGFYHFYAGKNRDPLLKIQHFKEALLRENLENVDIAFLKLCYVDLNLNNETEINQIFDSYQEALNTIKTKYPRLKFVHFTIPLRTRNKYSKGKLATLNKLVSRVTGNYPNDADNRVKELYNQKIRTTFKSDILFDIAEYESTTPDGTRISFNTKGVKTFALYEKYTDDGGHLNSYGQKYIAGKLIKLLSSL